MTAPSRTALPPAGTIAGTGEHQLVVFELGTERYGLDIAVVHEIIRHQPVTAVPQAPAFLDGVINLRGWIVPVVDLRRRLGMTAAAVTRDSRIVVTEVEGARVGLIVDGVSEVRMVPGAAIERPPAAATLGDASCVRGIAKLDDRLVILLDLGGLFAEADRATLAATGT